MKTRVYKLYATGTGGADAAAQLTIQRAGFIVAIKGAHALDTVTDNAAYHAELSFASAKQISTNDTVGPIFESKAFGNFATSGLMLGEINDSICGVAIPVQAGDRLYFNVSVSGTLTFYGSFYIYVTESGV